MDSFEGGIWFMGDLGDPWVVSIADALPASLGIIRVDCAGELPDRPFDPSHPSAPDRPAPAPAHRRRRRAAAGMARTRGVRRRRRL